MTMSLAGFRLRTALGIAAALLPALHTLAQEGGGRKKPDAEFAKQVNQAIDRGVAYLRKLQQKDGSWPREELGATALAGLALLESGVSASDDCLQKAAAVVRKGAVSETHGYSVATALLFLDRLGDPQDTPFIHSLAVRLLGAQQRSSGRWGYNTPAPSKSEVERLEAVLKARKPQAAGGTKGKEKTPGAAKLPAEVRQQIARINQGPGLAASAEVDLSNTQFAMLALWVARRHGVPVDRAFAAAEAGLRRSQRADGCWGYRAGVSIPSAQMTCAGVIGLVLARGVAEEAGGGKRDLADDRAIRAALLALKPVVGQPTGDLRKAPRLKENTANQTYYALWTLERAAVLFGLESVGGKDWYRWGAEILLANQKSDGSWCGAYAGGGCDTCFALLFLKHADLAADLTVKIKKDPGRPKLLEGIQEEEGKAKSTPAPPSRRPGGQSRAPTTDGPALRRPGVTEGSHRDRGRLPWSPPSSRFALC
jgi:hypothetical protein